MNEVVLAGIITYVIMLAAYKLHHLRKIHVPIMISIMVFDMMVPFYLYMNRDWKTRLIDDGDILSSMVWMHFGLLITLFVIYGLQAMAGRQLLRTNGTDKEARAEHKSFARGLLLTRALVIISGALLIQEEI